MAGALRCINVVVVDLYKDREMEEEKKTSLVVEKESDLSQQRQRMKTDDRRGSGLKPRFSVLGRW